MNLRSYSAFGSTEPVFDRAGLRIRWFCPRLVSSPDTLGQVLDQVLAASKEEQATRFTLRVVSLDRLDKPCLDLLDERGFRQEAALALGPPRGLVVTYIGKCAPGRQTDPTPELQEQQLLEAILSKPPADPVTIAAGFLHQGAFALEIADANKLSGEDIDRLETMHRETFPTFPYDFSSKLELMLANPASYCMVIARSSMNHRIYAFSNLEINPVELDDGTSLKLAEYDNTMRLNHCPDFGGVAGMGAVIRLALAQQAASLGADLCHAESRACTVPINAISHQIGMSYGGRLEQHLLISGQRDIEQARPSRYENMNTWFFNRDALSRLLEVSKPLIVASRSGGA